LVSSQGEEKKAQVAQEEKGKVRNTITTLLKKGLSNLASGGDRLSHHERKQQQQQRRRWESSLILPPSIRGEGKREDIISKGE